MTDNTKPEPSEELRLRITSLAFELNMRWCANTHATHLDFMSEKIYSFVQGEISRVRAEERERAKAEVAAAYKDAAEWLRNRDQPALMHPETLKHLAENIEWRTPADASRAFELAILDARLKEANDWFTNSIPLSDSQFHWRTRRMLDIAVRLFALKKKALP